MQFLKKYFYTFLSLVVLGGCTEIAPISRTEATEILFQRATYSAKTKATSQFEGVFKVYGFYTGDANWGEGNTIDDAVMYINGAHISNNGGVWKEYGNTYYWPKAGKMSFVSFAPDTVSVNINSAKSSIFTIDGIEPTYDFLIGDTATDLTGPNAVPILFHHVFSKVKFAAKISNVDSNGIKFETVINDISIGKITKKADFKWDSIKNNCSFDKHCIEDKKCIGSKIILNEELREISTNFYIPQRLSETNLFINYTTYLIEADSNTYVDRVDNIKNIPLNNFIDGEWCSGYSYVYNIIINTLSDDIILVPYIENNWGIIEHGINI